MLKILKNLKQSYLAVLFIIIFLCIQAVADLKLPNYTSKIVNIGIQQSGIENATPSVIRKTQLDALLMFSDDDELIKTNYEAVERNEENLNKYPALKNEDLYELKDVTDNKLEELNKAMIKPMTIINVLQNEEMANQIKEQLFQNLDMNINKDNNEINVISLIKSLPSQGFESFKDEIDKRIKDMPESILNQGAISAVKSEYEAIGLDTGKMSTDYIFITGLKMLGITLISMICAIIIMFLSAKVAAKFGKTIREKIFKKVLKFSNKEFNEFSTASLITRSTNDIQQIQSLLAILFRVVVYAPIMAIGGLILVISSSNLSMAWIIGVTVLIIIVIVLVLFATTMPKFKLMQELTDKLNLVSREIITGIPVIRAFNTQKKEEDRFEVANNNLMRNSIFVNRVMSMLGPLMTFIMSAVALVIVWVGGHEVSDGTIQVGDILAFIQYAMQIIFSFLMISIISIMLPRASVSAKRINEVLEKDPSIKDIDKDKEEKFNENKKGLVEFKNVSFRYPDADTEIITDITFTANPGETTAIIGSTGSGKSTIVNLIPRFYDVTEGEILIDGVNIKNVSQSELHKKIGYVPQKGVLFSGTIESNIKYGKDISEKEMKKIAEISQAKEFIEDKDKKYKSEIAQGGNNVSGGQKQRLSIARALAVDPEIFVFDDSFSALDMKTDRLLREALNKELKGKTNIIVAQRVGTIMEADQIIVIEDGQIVGKGTHRELMENCEEYKEIAMSQLTEEELKINNKGKEA